MYRPVAFAITATKETHGKVCEIQNLEANMTIYHVTPSNDMPDVIDARDQFGLRRYLKMGVGYLLAVPSNKLEWKEES